MRRSEPAMIGTLAEAIALVAALYAAIYWFVFSA
jgi:hypothetical protein